MPLIVGPGAGAPCVNRAHPFGMRIVQALQHERIHYGKNRRVCANAEREGEYSNSSEAGILRQHPKAVANILQKVFKPVPSPHVTTLLSQRQIVAEASLRRVVGFILDVTYCVRNSIRCLHDPISGVSITFLGSSSSKRNRRRIGAAVIPAAAQYEREDDGCEWLHDASLGGVNGQSNRGRAFQETPKCPPAHRWRVSSWS